MDLRSRDWELADTVGCFGVTKERLCGAVTAHATSPCFLNPIQPGPVNNLEQNEENLAVQRDDWETPELTTVLVYRSLASVR